MTEETKKLFDAPWIFCHGLQDGYGARDNTGNMVFEFAYPQNARRLARLPELYEALMYFVVNDCPHAFISNDECRLCPDKKCKTREAVELLRKVRDGE